MRKTYSVLAIALRHPYIFAKLNSVYFNKDVK